MSYLGNLAQVIDNKISGEYIPTDANSQPFAANHYGRDTRAGITDGMGPVGKALVDTGLSVGQTALTLPLGSTGGALLLAAEVAGDTTLDAKENGLSNEAALFNSTLAGVGTFVADKAAQKLLDEITADWYGRKAAERKVDLDDPIEVDWYEGEIPEGTESKTVKTVPNKDPDPNAVPKGSKTKISSNADSETARSLTRENESADVFAKKGYDIEQNPKVDGTKKPDYKIGENIFDNYSPNANTKPRSIASVVQDKIQSGQTERVVLNLSDWRGNIDDLAKQFKDWPIEGLKEILVIDKNGDIFNLLD